MTDDRGYLTPDECRAIEAAVEVTDEMRLAVRRDDCRRRRSHGDFDVFVADAPASRLRPMTMQCRSCGSTWRIHPDDVGREFGQGDRPVDNPPPTP